MYDEMLLTPLEVKQTNIVDSSYIFIEFLNRLEGWKTRCKNLHWAAPKKNIHVYLDEFLNVLSEYQDSLAEGYMGILGKMNPTCISAIAPIANNAMDLIKEIRKDTLNFYDNIPSGAIYKGVASECETFIQNINKYCYLFSLCDNHFVE